MSADENLAKLTLEAIEKLNLAMSELLVMGTGRKRRDKPA
jgi:hypothetical protein